MRIKHILPEESRTWEIQPAREVCVASDTNLKDLGRWQGELETWMARETDIKEMYPEHEVVDGPHVVPFQELLATNAESMEGSIIQQMGFENVRSALNEDQLQAYNIVDQHLQQTLGGESLNQL